MYDKCKYASTVPTMCDPTLNIRNFQGKRDVRAEHTRNMSTTT